MAVDLPLDRSAEIRRLLSLQNSGDGSWLNEHSPRWWEGNPLLATSYALLTLEAALPKSE